MDILSKISFRYRKTNLVIVLIADSTGMYTISRSIFKYQDPDGRKYWHDAVVKIVSKEDYFDELTKRFSISETKAERTIYKHCSLIEELRLEFLKNKQTIKNIKTGNKELKENKQKIKEDKQKELKKASEERDRIIKVAADERVRVREENKAKAELYYKSLCKDK